MAVMSEFYTTACAMGKTGMQQQQQQQTELIDFIGAIVGYPCTILCDPVSNQVNIAVISKKYGVTTDWLILKSNGALGIQHFLYVDQPSLRFLEVVCERQNAAHGLHF